MLIEKRIGPWINKKIMEYIGEEEPALTEFIINNVRILGREGEQVVVVFCLSGAFSTHFLCVYDVMFC